MVVVQTLEAGDGGLLSTPYQSIWIGRGGGADLGGGGGGPFPIPIHIHIYIYFSEFYLNF